MDMLRVLGDWEFWVVVGFTCIALWCVGRTLVELWDARPRR